MTKKLCFFAMLGVLLSGVAAAGGLNINVSDTNVMGYWKLNENAGLIAYDESTYGNNGYLRNGATWSTAGYDGNCVYVLGSGNECVEVEPFDITTANATMGCWVKYDGSLPPDYAGVIYASDASTSTFAGIHFVNPPSSNDGYGFQWNGNHWNCFGSHFVPAVNQWHFVALVAQYPLTATIYYYDGTALRKASHVHQWIGGVLFNSKLRLGCDGYYAGRDIRGWIDEGFFFKKSLTEGEMRGMLGLRQAYNPDPADGADQVPVNKVLGWTAGSADANKHDVYFGTSSTAVTTSTPANPLGVYKGRQKLSQTTYDPPGDLAVATFYYWRVDEVNASLVITKGVTWSFQTVSYKPVYVSPANGANIPHSTPLKWGPRAGSGPYHYNRYFGTSQSGVTNATTTSPEYKGHQETNAPWVPPADLGGACYWRIDAEDLTLLKTWKGDVWSYTTWPVIVPENFDTYIDDPALHAAWEDGVKDFANDSGSDIYLATTAAGEPSYSGPQALTYWYDNADYNQDSGKYYSEAVRTFSSPVNFTELGVVDLEIWFYGNAANNPNAVRDVMYVVLEDSATSKKRVEYGKNLGEVIGDLREESWHNWNTDLAHDFTGVNLASVKKLYLGFGNSSNTTTPGDIGLVYFDEFRLWNRRCIPSYVYADWTGDCMVGWDEMEIMADNWLKEAYDAPTKPPNNAKLELWWKLDETSGNSVADSSGKGRNGTAVGATIIDGKFAKARSFDGENDKVVSLANIGLTLYDTTITAWTKPDYPPAGTGRWRCIAAHYTAIGGQTSLNLYDDTLELHYHWAGDWTNWHSGLYLSTTGWTFTAMVVKYRTGGCDITCYTYDGTTLSQATEARNSSAFPPAKFDGQLALGTLPGAPAWTPRWWDGGIDDARLYSYALPVEELLNMAGVATIHVGLPDERPDLYEDGLVNYLDMVLLRASGWLEYQPFPEY